MEVAEGSQLVRANQSTPIMIHMAAAHTAPIRVDRIGVDSTLDSGVVIVGNSSSSRLRSQYSRHSLLAGHEYGTSELRSTVHNGYNVTIGVTIGVTVK